MPTPPSVAAHRLAGAAGATMIALGGSRLLVSYAGITLLTAAWWLARRHASGVRGAAITLACWAAPLLLTPPLFSRDAYSYLAQGAMVLGGMDVYTSGVAQLGGHLAAEVPQMWQDTPAPYGPVFLVLAAAVSAVTGGHLMLGVLALRLMAVIAVASLVVIVPRLARRHGVDESAALWLGVLNPLVPLHLVAGAHNDAVMLALLVAGLHLAVTNRFGAAAVLITLAALVKVPAALGLLVVGALAVRHAGLRSGLGRVAGCATVTAAAVTWLTGIGYGWIGTLATPAHRHSWSISTALGRILRRTAETFGLHLGAAPMRVSVALGLLTLVAACAAIWFYRHRFTKIYAAGLVLLGVALLGPATRPWYLLWGLVLLAVAAPPGRARQVAAIGAAACAFVALPSGFGPDGRQLVLAGAGVVAGLAAIAALLLLRTLRERLVVRQTGIRSADAGLANHSPLDPAVAG